MSHDPPSSASPSLDSLRTELDRRLSQEASDMVVLRRDLHAHPELAHEEFRTSGIVSDHLSEWGLRLHEVPGTGAVADLSLGAPDDAWTAIRADLDAVPISDDKTVPWRSRTAGRCHACGHDAHTTMALFAARALRHLQDPLRDLEPVTNLRFIFQPAEETATGARSFVEAGLVHGVRHLLALHCDPFLDVGQIGLKAGPITSNLASFRITLYGKGGHSARPYQTIDPIPAATNLVGMLYQLAPRRVDARHALCLSITSLHAGETFNAIPDEAVICGTLRTGRIEDERRVREAMDACLAGLEQATGCSSLLEWPSTTPATDNDEHTTSLLMRSARRIVGESGIMDLGRPSLGGEDFAFYQAEVPGAMARLGTGRGPRDLRTPLHSSTFDIDETALPLGARLLAQAAVTSLFSEPRR